MSAGASFELRLGINKNTRAIGSITVGRNSGSLKPNATHVLLSAQSLRRIYALDTQNGALAELKVTHLIDWPSCF